MMDVDKIFFLKDRDKIFNILLKFAFKKILSKCL